MSIRFFVSAVVVILVSGCVTPGSKKYEGVGFDSLIDSVAGTEWPDAQRRLAYRAKSLASKNGPEFEESFRNWCRAQGGVLDYGSATILSDLNTLHPGGTLGGNGARRACLDKDKKVLGAYVHDLGAIEFYTEAQAPAIRAEAERVSKERIAKSEAEWKKKNECRAEKTRIVRTNTRPGMHTNYGMVVEVKPPLAQLQAPGTNGPTLQWVEIRRLEPPFGEYCN